MPVLTLHEPEFYQVIATQMDRKMIDYTLMYFYHLESTESIQLAVTNEKVRKRFILSEDDLKEIVIEYVVQKIKRPVRTVQLLYVKTSKDGDNFRAKVLV